MATYTHKNLKSDVEDSAPGFGFAPNMEARFATDDMELEKSGVGYEKFAPNFRMPFGHAHREQEEVYVVISGGGRYKVEDEILEVKQWDALRVPPNTMRCFEAGPDGAEIIAFGAPQVADRREEAEMVPGWWSD
jgi:mannose-6-phosphate isomerase-like protein (cupin superfamily)